LEGGTWEDNIKIDLKEAGFEAVDWINLPQDKYWWLANVNTIMNLWVIQNSGNFLTS
jgi:hypothetical protein